MLSIPVSHLKTLNDTILPRHTGSTDGLVYTMNSWFDSRAGARRVGGKTIWYASRIRFLIAIDSILGASITAGRAAGTSRQSIKKQGGSAGHSRIDWPWGGGWKVECALLPEPSSPPPAVSSGAQPTGDQFSSLEWTPGWIASDYLNRYVAERKPWVSHAQLEVHCPDLAAGEHGVTSVVPQAGAADTTGSPNRLNRLGMFRFVLPGGAAQIVSDPAIVQVPGLGWFGNPGASHGGAGANAGAGTSPGGDETGSAQTESESTPESQAPGGTITEGTAPSAPAAQQQTTGDQPDPLPSPSSAPAPGSGAVLRAWSREHHEDKRGRRASDSVTSGKPLVCVLLGKLYGKVALMDQFLDARDSLGIDLALVYASPDLFLTDPRTWAALRQAAEEKWLRVVLWPPPSVYASMIAKKQAVFIGAQIHANLDAVLRMRHAAHWL